MTEWGEAIEKTLTWIEDNITEGFTLLDLANQAGYSPFHFSRLFHFVFGTTIKKYIADRRLYRAALDIKDTQERIIDIAVKYGFSSQEALTRALKSAYGHTPYAFRKNPNLIALPVRTAASHFEKIQEKREIDMSDYHKKDKQILGDFTRATGFARRLGLINIMSPNPLRLADFYKEVLGADITNCPGHGGPNRIEIWFGDRNENGSICIAAHYDDEFKPQTTNGNTFMGVEFHPGFEFSVADADAEYERIREMDVEIKYPPKDVPWGYRYFGIKDPDGNTIDLVAEK